MTQKIFKIIICSVAIMCMFCSTVTVFAEPGDVDFDFNIQPVEPTTQEEVVTTEPETQEEVTEEKQTQEETEEKTEDETTKKPNKPRPTQSQATNNNSGNNNNAENNAQQTQQTQQDDDLPEGYFLVFLERNNGERRLKFLMEEPGIIAMPEEPTREGYIFDGWYSDSKFKNEWDFEKDEAKREMTIYAKWIADSNTVEYDIIVEDAVGGKLETNPSKASVGEPVFITIIPDEGKRLVAGSLLINGKSTDVFSFVMPKGKVTISASFEDVPEDEVVEKKDNKRMLPLIIVGVIILVLVIGVVVAFIMRRRDFNADLDPNEPEVEDVVDDLVWVDKSIIVEDGFKEGKKVVDRVNPADVEAAEIDIEE